MLWCAIPSFTWLLLIQDIVQPLNLILQWCTKTLQNCEQVRKIRHINVSHRSPTPHSGCGHFFSIYFSPHTTWTSRLLWKRYLVSPQNGSCFLQISNVDQKDWIILERFIYAHLFTIYWIYRTPRMLLYKCNSFLLMLSLSWLIPSAQILCVTRPISSRVWQRHRRKFLPKSQLSNDHVLIPWSKKHKQIWTL